MECGGREVVDQAFEVGCAFVTLFEESLIGLKLVLDCDEGDGMATIESAELLRVREMGPPCCLCELWTGLYQVELTYRHTLPSGFHPREKQPSVHELLA